MQFDPPSLTPSPSRDYGSSDDVSKESLSLRNTWQTIRAAYSRYTPRRSRSPTPLRERSVRKHKDVHPEKDVHLEGGFDHPNAPHITQVALTARRRFLEQRLAGVMREIEEDLEIADARIASNNELGAGLLEENTGCSLKDSHLLVSDLKPDTVDVNTSRQTMYADREQEDAFNRRRSRGRFSVVRNTKKSEATIGKVDCANAKSTAMIDSFAFESYLRAKDELSSVRWPTGHSRFLDPSFIEPTYMARVDGPPHYDSWVPVRTCHWVGPNMPFEPYMPFFDDTEDDRAKVFNLYQDLLRDNDHQSTELSDMEIDDEGKGKELETQAEWTTYDSLDATVERAAVRHSLGVTSRTFGTAKSVLSVVSGALNVKPIARVELILKIMGQRSGGWETRDEKEKRKMHCRKRVVDFLASSSSAKPLYSYATNPSKYFCRLCMIFGCQKHKDRQAGPPQDIGDERADQRNNAWASGAQAFLKPCGVHCKLRRDAFWEDRAKESDFDWNRTEMTLVSEAVEFFKKDICGIARVVGSKTCRQVFEFLQSNSFIRSLHRMKNELGFREQSQVKRRKIVRKSKKNGNSGGKSDAEAKGNEEQMEKDFVPCDHYGECRPENCGCLQKAMRCEASCACNSIRWTRAKPYHRSGVLCSNRHEGCDCDRGLCSTDRCPCWRANRACNPDLCNHCGASIPIGISMLERDRRCQNLDVTIAKRKKTYVGKSEIHGLGLFAGERFYKGDLVGVYLGQALDTDIADIVGRIYEAKDHTFFFDLTESIVVDGGPFGSKTKFVNHIPSDDSRSNCGSRLVRVNGEPHIALYARKTIEPGSEFAFDYQFTDVVPEWAKPAGHSRSPSCE